VRRRRNETGPVAGCTALARIVQPAATDLFRNVTKKRGRRGNDLPACELSGTKQKQPFHFRRLDGALFGFAGSWERWKDTDGNPVETCSIITTEANGVVRPVHDRMPVILDPADYGQWLDPRTGLADLLTLLRPFSEEAMAAMAAMAESSYVSNARNQGPQCLQPGP
jgi:putative SOS response-associated peptidase YedK